MDGVQRNASGLEPVGDFADMLLAIAVVEMLARGEDFDGLCSSFNEFV